MDCPGGVELDAVGRQRVANDTGYAPVSRLYVTPFRGVPLAPRSNPNSRAASAL